MNRCWWHLTCAVAAFIVALGVHGADARAERFDKNLPKWGFSLSGAHYTPRISQDAPARQYYDIVFDQPEKREFWNRPALKTFEIYWYPWREYGLLGLTLAWGQWSVSGHTRRCTNADGSFTQCSPQDVLSGNSAAGADRTSLIVMPVTLGVKYHMDLLQRYWSIPLVFTAKGGFVYDFWWARAGSREAKKGDQRGYGGVPGVSGAVGVALNLDWIEPSTARSIERSGIAGTYLTADFNYVRTDGFGAKNRFVFNDTFLAIGLALELL